MRVAFDLLRALARATVRGPRKGTLVVQPLPGIGDMIWHLPHIHGIAAAEGAPVTVLTKRRSQADRIFRADPAVAEILWLERNPGVHSGPLGLLRLVRLLRAGRFAKAWLLHGSARYAWALLLAGIPITIGYGRGLQQLLLSHPVLSGRDETHGHPIELANGVLQGTGIARSEEEPQFIIGQEATAAIDGRFAQHPHPWVALGIGSSEAYKQWGAVKFAALASCMAKQRGATVFIVGGPADAALASDVVRHLEDGVGVIAVTDCAIDETAALLRRCALFIGNDTGALNLAAAVGTPAIGLFGASAPLAHSRHLHAVRPTGAAGMQGITVEAVLCEVAHRWPAKS